MTFNYYTDGLGNGTQVAQVNVVWTGGRLLDNVENIIVTMYKCALLANTCGTCVTLPGDKYACGWCGRVCAPAGTACNETGGWYDGHDVCPNPGILSFEPHSGPIEGGTRLRITGINLGRRFEDIERAVSVNNFQCDAIKEEYITATQIVCLTKSPASRKVSNGRVVVRLKAEQGYWNVSVDEFQYVDPVINGFSPRQGPRSGGTDVVISGRDLNAGSNVSVNLIDKTTPTLNQPCEVQSRTATEIRCRIKSGVGREKSMQISVKIDNAEKTFSGYEFVLQPDPVIVSIRPERTIASGGLKVEVRGERLDLVQRARMFVMNGVQRYTAAVPCEPANSGTMLCYTPDLQIEPTRRVQPTRAKPLDVDYGFEMDGVVTQMKGRAGFKSLAVYPDPTIFKFRDVKYVRSTDDYLIIQGENIDVAAAPEDVSIQIGRDW
jgi:plexin A